MTRRLGSAEMDLAIKEGRGFGLGGAGRGSQRRVGGCGLDRARAVCHWVVGLAICAAPGLDPEPDVIARRFLWRGPGWPARMALGITSRGDRAGELLICGDLLFDGALSSGGFDFGTHWPWPVSTGWSFAHGGQFGDGGTGQPRKRAHPAAGSAVRGRSTSGVRSVRILAAFSGVAGQ